MDVFRPKEPNGAGVIVCISGGWVSDHDKINPILAAEMPSRTATPCSR